MTERLPTDAERAQALAVLSLLRDGRAVPEADAARARELAERDDEVRATVAAWDRQSALLAAEPAVSAPSGFTERVLAAWHQGAEPAEVLVLPLLRRLAVAAALLVSVSVGWSLARPAELHADGELQRQRHVVDHMRRTPFAPDDIEAGLRARKDDPEFVERYGALPGPEGPR